MTAPLIAIITPDTLRAHGVASIVNRYFGLEPVITDEPTDETVRAALFVTDTHTFASHQAFFLPRRSRTLIITEQTSPDAACISSRQPLEDWIEQLQRSIESITSTASETASELTQRERDVLALIAAGLPNKAIADRLCISLNTVLTHRKNIVAKLGIHSISGLSLYALMHGYTIEQ